MLCLLLIDAWNKRTTNAAAGHMNRTVPSTCPNVIVIAIIVVPRATVPRDDDIFASLPSSPSFCVKATTSRWKSAWKTQQETKCRKANILLNLYLKLRRSGTRDKRVHLWKLTTRGRCSSQDIVVARNVVERNKHRESRQTSVRGLVRKNPTRGSYVCTATFACGQYFPFLLSFFFFSVSSS